MQKPPVSDSQWIEGVELLQGKGLAGWVMARPAGLACGNAGEGIYVAPSLRTDRSRDSMKRLDNNAK